ncbi:MAG: hypothetical protein ING91_19475 [Rhodocyclaceae bacterium]|nr:hypothetical protein [Rhodocyclaceae bacterium]MCA3116416.1 hypothetical protein [Rhodocyclaceae bacterium]
MSFAAGDAIADVRDALQDTDLDLQRYADATILEYLSDGLVEICLRRPDLFSTLANIPLVSDPFQSAPADSVRVIDVLRLVGGDVLVECEKDSVDANDPGWMTQTGTPLNWMRYVKDPNRFLLAPVPTGTETAQILYAKTPARVETLAAVVPLPDAYRPALVSYGVFRAETKNDQSVVDGRAKLMWDVFLASLTASIQSKATTDGFDNGPKTARGAR